MKQGKKANNSRRTKLLKSRKTSPATCLDTASSFVSASITLGSFERFTDSHCARINTLSNAEVLRIGEGNPATHLSYRKPYLKGSFPWRLSSGILLKNVPCAWESLHAIAVGRLSLSGSNLCHVSRTPQVR